jgi:hypothetical protein
LCGLVCKRSGWRSCVAAVAAVSSWISGQSGIQSRKIHGHESVRFELFEKVEAYRNGRLKSKAKEDIGISDVHVERKWCKGRPRKAVDTTVGDVGELKADVGVVGDLHLSARLGALTRKDVL